MKRRWQTTLVIETSGDAVQRTDVLHFLQEHFKFLNARATGLDAVDVKFIVGGVHEVDEDGEKV